MSQARQVTYDFLQMGDNGGPFTYRKTNQRSLQMRLPISPGEAHSMQGTTNLHSVQCAVVVVT